MAARNKITTRLIARFLAGGILLSMITVYLLHYFGTWDAATYRPDAETTGSLIVSNKCAVLGDTHTLQPSGSYTSGVNSKELKFAGSFMNFFDGHIVTMVLIAFAFAAIMVVVKKASIRTSSSGSFSQA